MKYGLRFGILWRLNLGDEAILEVIWRELRASLDVDIVVFSLNPKDTEPNAPQENVVLRMHSVG